MLKPTHGGTVTPPEQLSAARRRNVLEFSGMLGSNVWNFMECSGIFGNVGVECFGILWNVLECSGMKPYVLACFGHFMEDTELWGNH